MTGRLRGRAASRPRPGRRSLRTRVTVVASLAITAAVVLGVLAMYLLQMQSVRSTIDGQLRTYATQIAQSANNGKWPQPLAGSTLDANAEAQVLGTDGQVLGATRTLTGLPPVYALAAGSSTPVRQKAADGVIPRDVRVAALRTTVDGQQVTILTGTSTDLLSQVDAEFSRHLLYGLPIILVLAAGTVWMVVGRALRPVKKISTAAAAITSADLSRRVPEPGTSDEIGNLASTMNDMLARLEDSAHKQRRFVADASHELRTPLAAIRTTLEVGLAHPDQAPWPTIAERAASQALRLEELIQQLLMLAKADEHTLATDFQSVDINALLQDVSRTALLHDVELDLRLGPSGHTYGNRDDLTRLFSNLLDNAIRYAHSRVVIEVTPGKDAIDIEISDDGPGIPEADRRRVFGRFVRLDDSRGRGSGSTGLGLAIAGEIAIAHGGSIEISDSDSGGVKLRVLLCRIDQR
jgi:signal transduction histidine kinase